jgi:hypothetical protein
MYHYGNEEYYKDLKTVEEGLGSYVKSKVDQAKEQTIGALGKRVEDEFRSAGAKVGVKIAPTVSKFLKVDDIAPQVGKVFKSVIQYLR